MHVMLVSGWRGVGKDQLGAALCTRYGYRRYAFADVLKDYCAKRYKIPRALFDHREKKDVPLRMMNLSPRALCIREAKRLREHDDAFFARILLRQLVLDKVSRVVITDWRFPVERQVLAASPHVQCMLTVRLCWPANASEHPLRPPLPAEVSEHVLDNASFDFILPTPLNINQALTKLRTYQPEFFVR